MPLTVYAMRVKTGKDIGKYLRMQVTGNEPDNEFCNDVAVELTTLDSFHYNIWTTVVRSEAEHALTAPVKWYNSDLDRPVIEDPENVEIVEIQFP